MGRALDVATGLYGFREYRYVATNGQTTFSGADADGRTLSYIAGMDPLLIQVFVNGFRTSGPDFTATSGTSVVMSKALLAGDEVLISVRNRLTFYDGNTYLKTEEDGLLSYKFDKGGGTVTGATAFSAGVTFTGADPTIQKAGNPKLVINSTGVRSWGIRANAANGNLVISDETGAADRLVLSTTGDLWTGASGQGWLSTLWSYAKVIDRAYAEYTTYSSAATALPDDDTIPQVGEGTQVLSCAITPKSSSNLVRVYCFLQVGHSVANSIVTGAVFRNGAANAITAGQVAVPVIASSVPLALYIQDSPASTSTQTYTVRIGPNSGTSYINGGNASRKFGGVMRSAIILEEVVP